MCPMLKRSRNGSRPDDRIDFVTYAGLESSPYYDRKARICPKGAGGLFTFAVKGGYDACVKLIDNVKLFSHVANLGDARSTDYPFRVDHPPPAVRRTTGGCRCCTQCCSASLSGLKTQQILSRILIKRSLPQRLSRRFQKQA